jgi:DNA-binding transcriptional LysR family regulator
MNLELLRTFVTFAKSKNIVEAARQLRVSQPAVTLQLQRLEQGFRHPIFSQQGKKKVLTPFGRALLEETEPLLSRIESSVEQVEKRFADPSQIALRIGARAEVLSRIVQRIRFPGTIQFVPLRTQEAVDQLLSHEIDIAISYLRPDLAHIHSRKIFSDQVQWVCHESLLKKLTVQQASRSLPFLTQTPFLAYKEDAPFLKDWFKHLGNENEFGSVRPKRICEDWNAILKLVEQGEGYSLIPSSLVSANPELKSLLLPAQILPEMTFYALFHFDLMKIAAIEKTLGFGA